MTICQISFSFDKANQFKKTRRETRTYDNSMSSGCKQHMHSEQNVRWSTQYNFLITVTQDTCHPLHLRILSNISNFLMVKYIRANDQNYI